MSNVSQTTQQDFSSQEVLQALQEMRSKLEAVNKAKTEPIAIVGMACRFPGGANNPSTFWRLLHDGIDAITPVPPQRWDVDAYYDPDPEVPEKAYTKQGGFIDQVDQFDPLFFGISPREAISLDPQYRLLLEVTWEALENAGQTWTNLKNSKTSVFMGISTDDYAALGNPILVNNNRSLGVGRISHLLGLQGSNVQLDTACSSALVAIHLACQNLRSGESDLALVGGVNLILSPTSTIGRCQMRAVSPDGRCKTFDAAANGYGQAEGCGVVVLKRLSDAISDSDLVSALIRGSAINHDGPSSGITVPNGMAQKQVIQEALSNARLEPHQVSYLEAHGTGTALGDPIEIEALAAIYGKNRPVDQPLVVGSVKTNIGHLEAAAGVSALIKVILALQHQEIPPHLHLKQPNPLVDWERLPIKIPTSLMPWTGDAKPRIAGISSFSISGTNAHLLVEETPSQVKSQKVKGQSEDDLERPLQILTLSAKTEKALKELVSRYQSHFKTYPELSLTDVCYTANTGRAQFNHRLAVIASEPQELTKKLRRYTAGEEVVGVFSGKLPNSGSATKIAFLFTGQGSQYLNMGRQLYETQPTFRQTLDTCDQILRPYLEHPLLEVLYPQDTQNSSSSLLDQTAYTQPALFALEYALLKLWESWGIKPNVVMGHSVGEYVAATVAGIFSLEDGLRLIAARGKLMQQLPSGGEMVSLLASESQVAKAIAEYHSQVAIAAVNGPESVVISGESEAIAKICRKLEAMEIKIKPLQVSHAFHSPLMTPMLAEFETVANQITYYQPRIPVISNVTAITADHSIATGKYWVDHVRQPVKFAQSMDTLHQLGCEIFLEIGPKPVLLGMGRESLMGTKGKKLWLPSLRPGKQDWVQMLQSLGQLYVQGAKVDWSGFDQDYAHQKVVLPTYPWQRRRCWITDLQNNKQEVSQISSIKPIKTITNKTSKQQKIKLLDLDLMSVPQASLVTQIPKRQLVPLKTKSIQPEPVKVTPKSSTTRNGEPMKEIQSTSELVNSKVDIFQLKEALKQQLADALYVEISEIEEDQKFIDLGLDSVVGVEWITTINRHYGLEIKATKLYDYPTLVELTQYIAQTLSSNGKNNFVENKEWNQSRNQANLQNHSLRKSTSLAVSLSALKETLKQQLADALYVEIGEIEEDQKFIDLGLDSVVGVEWITTINKTYKLEIKATKLYDYPTLLDLAEYIAQEISHTSSKFLQKESPEVDNSRGDFSENFKRQLRSILNKVANNELTIQVANQMIQELKQKSNN
ncbi:MAG: acyltransferase domain-containing protein [Symploca sp. SIO2G7]|nr:acyltransferase domain-containing protein [Symploca sp. SIO2G7]